MVVQAIGKTFTKIFGSRNERLVKAYTRRVEQINELEDDVRRLSDAELRAKTAAFREQVAGGERIGAVMPQVMAVAREVMDRAVGCRNIFNPDHGFDASQLPSDLQRQYEKIVEQVAALEPKAERGCAEPVPPWMQVEIPVALYDAVRKLYPESRPPFRTRPFDVQLIGGMVLGNRNGSDSTKLKA